MNLLNGLPSQRFKVLNPLEKKKERGEGLGGEDGREKKGQTPKHSSTGRGVPLVLSMVLGMKVRFLSI